ncbi:MAG: hypothetical protein AAF529_13800 [Pseudomonadota bacterium]
MLAQATSRADFRIARLVCFWLLATFLSAVTHAATQGNTDSTSTGSIDIHATQNIIVGIRGFDDMVLGDWSGTGAMVANDDICIARNAVPFFGTGSYRILAAGDGEPGDPAAFTLSNGLDRIYYNAYFNDQAGTAGRTQLTGGVALTGQTGFGLFLIFNLFACNFGNANISIEVPESELSSSAGPYSGTLTLTLQPE